MSDLIMLPSGDIQKGHYAVSPHCMERYAERAGKPLEQIFDDLDAAHVDWDYRVKGKEDHYALRSGRMVFICKCVGVLHHVKTVVQGKERRKKK